MSTHYFSPGPAVLPMPVRDRIRSELLDTFGIGVSVMEISHRSKHYGDLNDETHALARKVFEVPDSHEIIFTPYGAQQHFCLIINQLSEKGDTLAYTDTGVWAHAAVLESQSMSRKTAVVFNSEPVHKDFGNFAEWDVPKNAKYLHLTVNNTVEGTEYKEIPTQFGVPLVLDLTSSIGARNDIPWEHTALAYASAQKNFGIAGVSIVIIRKDVLERTAHYAKINEVGHAMTYKSIFSAKSILNTPPVFAIYVANRMLQWMENVGGIKTLESQSLEKAGLVYNEIDAGFYIGRATKEVRSRHNFVFGLPNAQLDELFISEAAKNGILEIKGYRTTGGVRSSMYLGVPVDGAHYFAEFMRDFRKQHG